MAIKIYSALTFKSKDTAGHRPQAKMLARGKQRRTNGMLWKGGRNLLGGMLDLAVCSSDVLKEMARLA
jgi:hypothetical protein